ncbi:MAG: DUF1351 domain-containing protein [Lachnospiraceae bacterium]|nr:DUF1351 domain-containing protein [Lachnospiraceae bacterium]
MSQTNHEVTITQQPALIQCDFEKAKAYLAERLQEYQGVIFTEDTKADAKKTVAELRKEKKAFEDRVKEVKKEYMKPFEVFHGQAQELIEMYEQPITFINTQVADFERKRVAERQEYIKNLYNEFICDMAEVLPLSRIYNEKWENATTSKKAICDEIIGWRDEARNAINAIKGMHSEAEEKALAIYMDTLDLSKAMLHISQYEAQKQEIMAREQERLRQEEQERIRREERAKLEAEQRAIEAERRAQEEKEAALRQAEAETEAAVAAAREEAAQEVIDSLIAMGDGVANLYEYRLSMTDEQKEKLELYLNSVGIDWEMI